MFKRASRRKPSTLGKTVVLFLLICKNIRVLEFSNKSGRAYSAYCTLGTLGIWDSLMSRTRRISAAAPWSRSHTYINNDPLFLDCLDISTPATVFSRQEGRSYRDLPYSLFPSCSPQSSNPRLETKTRHAPRWSFPLQVCGNKP